MKSVTAGERLYLLIREEVLDSTGSSSIYWSNLGSFFNSMSGGPGFSLYIKGAVAVHAVRRLLRYWEAERTLNPNEAQHVRKVANFVTQEMFPALGDGLATKVARSVIAAERASGNPIKPSVRSAVLKGRKLHTCYLCGRQLDINVPKENSSFLTLEHVWPTSIGGDSIEDNLLPACTKCQVHTMDTISWEWLNVHNFVLPADLSTEALGSISGRIQYARHYLEALQLCDSEHLSLKEAFLRLGVVKAPLSHTRTGLPITFFDLQTA